MYKSEIGRDQAGYEMRYVYVVFRDTKCMRLPGSECSQRKGLRTELKGTLVFKGQRDKEEPAKETKREQLVKQH